MTANLCSSLGPDASFSDIVLAALSQVGFPISARQLMAFAFPIMPSSSSWTSTSQTRHTSLSRRGTAQRDSDARSTSCFCPCAVFLGVLITVVALAALQFVIMLYYMLRQRRRIRSLRRELEQADTQISRQAAVLLKMPPKNPSSSSLGSSSSTSTSTSTSTSRVREKRIQDTSPSIRSAAPNSASRVQTPRSAQLASSQPSPAISLGSLPVNSPQTFVSGRDVTKEYPAASYNGAYSIDALHGIHAAVEEEPEEEVFQSPSELAYMTTQVES